MKQWYMLHVVVFWWAPAVRLSHGTGPNSQQSRGFSCLLASAVSIPALVFLVLPYNAKFTLVLYPPILELHQNNDLGQ